MTRLLILLLFLSVINASGQTLDSLETYREPFHYSYHFTSFNDYNPGKATITYQNIWLAYHQLSWGVTNNATINGGGLLGTGLTWIGIKVGIPLKKNVLNAGFASRAFFTDGDNAILSTAQLTFGPPSSNISIGVTKSNKSDNALMTIKGMLSVGDRFYFMTENYLANPYQLDGDVVEQLISYIGGRVLVGKDRVALEIGLIILPAVPFSSGGSIFTLPFLGISVPFHNKK